VRAAEASVVVTKDEDFVRLLERHGPPPQIVWVTCGNVRNAALRAVVGTGVAVAITVAVACGRAGPRPSASAAGDSAAVAALVGERLQAALAGDTARWHRLVSDSCLWVGGGLRVERTRDVLPAIAANRAIRPAAQQIRELAVHVTGDVAQAAYVQQVQDAGQASESGKRFRKVDTFVRRERTWLLIGAFEVAAPFRAHVVPGADAAARLAGRYALGAVDTLDLAPGPGGRFTLRGRAGTVDTLLAESDTVLFQEGDVGAWVLPGASAGAARALVYRSPGAADIVLPRVPRP
jgi:hypothetical protein